MEAELPTDSGSPADPPAGADPEDPPAGADPQNPPAGADPEDPLARADPQDPPAGADPAETEPPWGDGGAEEVLRLRREVAGLGQQLRTQQERWAAILHDLRAEMDSLREQGPGPRGPDAGRPDAGRPGASPRPRREPGARAAEPAGGKRPPVPGGEDTARRRAARSRSAPLLGRALSPPSAPSSQPLNITVERIESGKMASYEDGDKTVSIRLRIRTTLPVEPASSPRTAQPAGTEPEKAGGAARRPAGRVLAGAAGARGAGCEGPKDQGLRTTILRFPNGDVKKTLPDNRQVYYCASTGTTRVTHPSGLVVVRFPNKRTEKFYPNGLKETLLPDGTVTRFRDDQEETVFPDGTVLCVARNGDKTIVFSDGQRDVHTAEFKRREHPDGSARTVYRDGRQEVRLASGRGLAMGLLVAPGETEGPHSVFPDAEARL